MSKKTRKRRTSKKEKEYPEEGLGESESDGEEAESKAEKLFLDRVIHSFKFAEFDEQDEGWSYYISRFEVELKRFARGRTLPNDVQSALFLSCVGSGPFKILVDHFRPTDVSTVPYKQLRQVLDSYYVRATCIFAERRAFATRHRERDEAVAKYVSALRTLAGTCEFGENLEERLRDQLVIGINEARWQEELIRLHPNNNATFQEVETTALGLEQAVQQRSKLKSLEGGSSWKEAPEDLRRVGGSPGRKGAVGQEYKQPANRQDRPRNKDPRKLYPHKDCLYCGFEKHDRGVRCPAEKVECSACGKPDHYSRVCVSKGNAVVVRNKQKTRRVQKGPGEESASEGSGSDTNQIRALGSRVMVPVIINGMACEMLYDSGAAQTVVGKRFWKQIGSPKLRPTGGLVAYTGIPIKTLGKARVNVTAWGQSQNLTLVVIDTEDSPLFGLDWAIKFKVPMPDGAWICAVTESQLQSKTHTEQLEHLKVKYAAVFQEGTCKIIGHSVQVRIKPGVEPKVFRPRPVPFAMCSKIEQELARLEGQGIIEPVDTTSNPLEWAAPVVVAVKSNGSIRICGDFRVTINPHVVGEEHPMPTFDEIVTKLTGSMIFSVIDLKDAYLQLEVEEGSRNTLGLATHKGYYRYKRLPFGVSFAPKKFQKTMDAILTGVPNVAWYLDDIIVGGRTYEEHFEAIEEVLGRLDKAGIKTQEAKCKWLQSSVKYLGHVLDAKGIRPVEDHVEAITRMPQPTNVQELKSFLGTVNFYARFIENLQGVCAPLHELTRKGIKWKWTDEAERAFQRVKQEIRKAGELVHYSLDLPVGVAADASGRGLGAVLWHRLPGGEEKPVAFASRVLSSTETKYSAIDREALALVFAVKKFDQYLRGREFIMRTDHKPLMRILAEGKEIPKIAANRLIRWALILRSYDFKVEHIQGKDNCVADTLSRLPVEGMEASGTEKSGKPFGTHLLHVRLQACPVTTKELKEAIKEDEVLQKVRRYIEGGWPDKKDLGSEWFPYFEKRDEMSFEEGILLWNGRIVSPKKVQTRFLEMLHLGHPGVRAMRDMARMHVWWPQVDLEIERFVRGCDPCQEGRQKPEETPIYSWNVPDTPWTRLHVDYAGPFEGFYWLIVVDSTSKWLEAIPLRKATARTTIEALKEIFSRFGNPVSMVSDNGPQFASEEFRVFCKEMLVKHIRITPYHPRSNGLAERAVRTFKSRVKASKQGGGSILERVRAFLLSYRVTPHSTTKRSPSEVLFRHRMRTPFDLLKPSVGRNVEEALMTQKMNHDQGTKFREFREGQEVWVLNKTTSGYKRGRVTRRTGDLSYHVLVDGREERKHVDQLRSLKKRGENM